MRHSTRFLLPATLLIWLTIVITGYYWGHQYALILVVAGLVRLVAQLAVLGLIALVALGLGKLLSRLIRIEYSSVLEQTVFAIGLGMALMSVLMLVLGELDLISRPLLWVLTVPIAAGSGLWTWRSRRRPSTLKTNDQERLQRVDRLFLAFAGVVLILGLLLALAPPIAWDGLSTHLVLVSQILRDGGLHSSVFTDRPIVGHLLFTWGMALGGDVLPQLISYGQALVMVAAVAIFSRRNFGRRTAVLAVALLCSVEVFVITAGWPYADVPSGMFGLLAILSLINWQLARPSGRGWLIASFIFAVFSAHAKLNGLFIYAAMLPGLLSGLWWQRAELRRRSVDVALALVVGLLLAVLWTAVENDLRPVGSNDVAQIAGAMASVAGGGETATAGVVDRIAQYLDVIWEMTVVGQQGGLRYDGTISPFFLILTPVLLLLPRKPKVVWALLTAGLTLFFAWLIIPRGYYQNRHLIAAFPIFSILAAYFISRLPEWDFPQLSISGFMQILLVLVLGLQMLFFFSWYKHLDPSAYLLGVQSRSQYLGLQLNQGSSPGYYDMMEVINGQLAEDSVVGVAWPEPRVYYCQRSCIRYVFGRRADVQEMVGIAHDEGLTHLLVSRKGLRYWLEYSAAEDDGSYETILAYRNALDTFVAKYGVLEQQTSNSFYLYRLEFDDS